MSDPAPSPPRDPVAGPIPPAYILRFFDDDDGDPFTAEDWLGMVNSYYEVPYRVLVADLEKFAQRVRDGALREAADLCHFLAEKDEASISTAKTDEWREAHRHRARGGFTCYRAVGALIGTAPKESPRG